MSINSVGHFNSNVNMSFVPLSLWGIKTVYNDTSLKNKPVNNPLRDRNFTTQNPYLYGIYSPNQVLSAYLSPKYLEFLFKSNPKVKEILDSKGLGVNISPENILNTSRNHLITTKSYALLIASKLNLSKSDKNILEQACVFHDFGKVLIPSELLEKPNKLNEQEKAIVDLHSELGYELLKSTKLNKKVLDLVKNHHEPAAHKSDILCQILSVADIYSALREERSYKAPMSQNDALALLDQKAKNGEVSTEVVDALKTSILMS